MFASARAVREQVVARQVRQRPEPLALAPGDQPSQVSQIGAPRVRRAAGAIAQEEDHRMGIVGHPEGVRDHLRIDEAARPREPSAGGAGGPIDIGGAGARRFEGH
ncbi:hypothetical protein [Paraburkholderia polaris]|uniref:hypothetical protein n=1 Tax=Paraburkholderia polaris TaxID=2728848 RepID=UPI0038B2FB3E